MTSNRTAGPSRFSWSDITDRMRSVSVAEEPRLRELLSYLATAGGFCDRLLRKANEITEESAQKTLGVYLAVQAFRASTATARLSLDGYGDIAAGLARSVWETQLRLKRVREGGEFVALAEIFVSINREIIVREAGLSEDDSDESRRILDTWKSGRADILAKATARGGTEEQLRRLGGASVEKLANDAAVKTEYDIWYRALSQMHHGGRAFVTYHELLDVLPEGGSLLLPVSNNAVVMTAVALEHLYRSISESALIFGDHLLALDVERAHVLLGLLLKNIFSEDAA